MLHAHCLLPLVTFSAGETERCAPASFYAKLELISFRSHLPIHQLLFILHTMMLNSGFLWVGIFLFIPSTQTSSLAHCMCFKKFKLKCLPNFPTIVLNGYRCSVILNAISSGNHLVCHTALAEANCGPNAEMHHLRHLTFSLGITEAEDATPPLNVL